jgi:hypothetical protein
VQLNVDSEALDAFETEIAPEIPDPEIELPLGLETTTFVT